MRLLSRVLLSCNVNDYAGIFIECGYAYADMDGNNIFCGLR